MMISIGGTHLKSTSFIVIILMVFMVNCMDSDDTMDYIMDDEMDFLLDNQNDNNPQENNICKNLNNITNISQSNFQQINMQIMITAFNWFFGEPLNIYYIVTSSVFILAELIIMVFLWKCQNCNICQKDEDKGPKTIQSTIVFITLLFIELLLNFYILMMTIFNSIVKNYYINNKTTPINQSIVKKIYVVCQGLGFFNVFMTGIQVLYMFGFLVYLIIILRDSLRKISLKRWNIFIFSIVTFSFILTLVLQSTQLIGPNFYGYCGFTLLTKFVQIGSSTKKFLIVVPSMQLFCICVFFALGLYTYSFYKNHKSNRKKVITSRPVLLAFVIYFTLLGVIVGIGDLVLSFNCIGKLTNLRPFYLMRFINYYRPLGYIITLFLFLFNSNFRHQFWRKFKSISQKLLCIKTNQYQLAQKQPKKQIQMKQIFLNEQLLQIKDDSQQIDLIFIQQIFTIISCIYTIYYQYFNKQYSNYILIKQIHFQQYQILEIDKNYVQNYQKDQRKLIKIKILKSELKVYFPEVFKDMLKADGIQNVHQSFKIMDNLLKMWSLADGDGGKSGQFFFFTNDYKYAIKTITKQELQSYRKKIKDFYYHYKKNKNSIISKIYGLFTISGQQMPRKYRFILMKNIRGCQPNQIIRIYDLKGSKYDRRVQNRQDIQNNQQLSKTLKDQDFQNLQKNRIKISKQYSEKLKQIIQIDVNFLCKQKTLDYSLLLIRAKWFGQPQNPKFWSQYQRIKKQKDEQFGSQIQNQQYYHIGIIDYLQQWNLQKQSQSWFKKMLLKTILKKKKIKTQQVSAIQPSLYSTRFLKYIKQILNYDNKQINIQQDNQPSNQPTKLGQQLQSDHNKVQCQIF